MPDVLNPLAQRLRDEIARAGPMSFRDFMAQALYDPEHGYYGSGKARVGRGGDFFTNVSVGPFFGRLLARQFSEMWRLLDQPADFVLVEQGAHHGDGAADVLAALREDDPPCFQAAKLWLVEPFPALQRTQREKLCDFASGKVHWANTIEGLPHFRGVHYSNELLDAFPVHRVVRRGTHWMERAVDFQDGRFAFIDAEINSAALRYHLAQLPDVPPDYETEVNLAAAGWLADVAGKLRAGFILAIDYGYPRQEYYRPERTTGTLSAYAAHQRESDPLQRPGEIDLTAHVDFSSVAEAAERAELQIAGFTDQHHFMVGLARLHFPDDHTLSAAGQKELRAFQTLMHPGFMGRSFHALCLAKDVANPALAGFQFATDPRQRLLAM